MVNTLSFRTNNYNDLFVMSDFHCGHEKDFILNPRKFKDANEAKETLISSWNTKVGPGDVGFLLGDTVVGAGQNSDKVFQELLLRLSYKELYLMPGNHFARYKQIFEAEIEQSPIDKYYRLTFTLNGKLIHLIPNYYEIVVDRQLIILSHYPIYSWRDIGKGSWMLHGHCHGRINGHLKGKILDFGPESIGNFPLSFGEIKAIMDAKGLESPDYH